MATWKRILIIYLATPVICAFTYVTAVVVIEGGVELGEPMWKGFLLQVGFLLILGFIYFGILFLPAVILVEKLVDSATRKLSVYGVITLVLHTIAYVQYSGANLISSISVSVIATIILLVLQYLIIRSGSRFAHNPAKRAGT